MGMEGCGKCLKYSLFTVNLIIWVGGIAILAIGIWTLLDKSYLENFFGTNLYKSSASILMAMGVIVTFIAFLGCFGAVREIKCMLLTYFIILFLIFVILLVGGVLAYVFRDKAEGSIRTQMLRSISEYGKPGSKYTDSWDAGQKQFKCCGVSDEMNPDDNKGYLIWSQNKMFSKGALPESCCKPDMGNVCGNKTVKPTPDSFFERDCLSAVVTYVKGHAVIIGGVSIGIASVMIFGMFFSLGLFRMIE